MPQQPEPMAQLGTELAARAQMNAAGNAALQMDKPKNNLAKPVENSPKDRINPNARYGDRPGEERIDTSTMTKPLPSQKGAALYDKGGVVKVAKPTPPIKQAPIKVEIDTGKPSSSLPALPQYPTPGKLPLYDKGGKVNINDGKHQLAILKDGERVLTQKQAKEYDMHNPMDAAKDAMTMHEKHAKSGKKLKEIRTRKGENGGYIHEHHHHAPHHMPEHMEEHVSPDQDAMASHMMEHMGEPNPGEAEADAGQHGIPDGTPGAPPAPAAA
jgi:hypothetical protein